MPDCPHHSEVFPEKKCLRIFANILLPFLPYAAPFREELSLRISPDCVTFYIMMPGSKGLSPHELAHRWVKDLRTRPDMSIKVG